MEISKKDRVLLINQYKILSAIKPDESDHYNELIDILENGYEIFYSMIDEWISDEMPSDEGRFVLDILDLYRAIEYFKRSTKSEAISKNHFSVFAGFDGNNETQYMGFARFLIETQGKFSEQEQYFRQNDHLNSHMPMVSKYKKMLDTSKNYDIWNMTEDQALAILNS